MDLIDQLPDLAEKINLAKQRPLVTLCYAQSLDGSITARRGSPLLLSGEESFRYVHRLRAACDGILVGIGTVLADDPQLTVRLVPGKHPQPIILDRGLRFPASARMLSGPGPRPWLATDTNYPGDKRDDLINKGVQVLPVPVNPDGKLNLPRLLNELLDRGISSLMVEGGAQVITSFIQQRLADALVLTLVPVYVGGLRALQAPLFDNHSSPPPLDTRRFPRLIEANYQPLGQDLVITGWLV
jgi:3,4-dihydroxy 2-butanone 4-phosphate synthase/GTP cyclohydrolase II